MLDLIMINFIAKWIDVKKGNRDSVDLKRACRYMFGTSNINLKGLFS